MITTAISTCVSAQETKGTYTQIVDESNLTLLNPSLAQRKSAKIRLNNGLEAFLVSDPQAEQSAAALSVEAGSWHDPKEYPGMAHFLEHMLFLGTNAYPKENEYDQFITDNGGTMNAATYPDHTVYMFSINNDAFEGAIDRFSHFFIDPLLSTSSINRELHAVDQEHAKNVENDYRRQYMIFKETGNPLHPNASFSTGNAKTLSGIPQNALRQWYQAQYHASRMHLFILSTLPLEQMTALTVNHFSSIQNTPQERLPITESLVSSKQLGHIIYMKPIKDLKELSLSWEVPKAFCGDIEKTSLELIAFALKAEGKNSLVELLKKEKIADRLSVDISRQDKDTLIFGIDISLTPYGVSQIYRTIELTFQAIASLKEQGVPPYLFAEMQKISLLKYQYQSRKNAFKIAMKTANELLYEKLESYPRLTTQPAAFDPVSIEGFLNQLTPHQCLYNVIADPSLTHIPPTHSEKWTKAEYAIQQIPDDLLNQWKTASAHKALGTPEPNPFIPKELALIPPSSESVPQLLFDDDATKIYHLQDRQYLVPTVSTLFNIKSPLITGSAKQTVLATLFLKSLQEKLSSLLFNADIAGLHPEFGLNKLNITIGVQGYSEKAPLLIQDIFSHLKTVQPTSDEFDLYKEALLSLYDNASHELPLVQAIEIAKSIVTQDAPTNRERYEALQAVTFEEFNQFSEQLFKKTYLEGFLFGNIAAADAKTLVSNIKSTLASDPYPKTEQQIRKMLRLEDKKGPYVLSHFTPRQGNGVLLLLDQGTFSFEKRAAQQLLGTALKNAFYDTLRTKQQTAYFTLTQDKEEERALFQFFGVQSSTHQPRDLLARFDLFLEDFTKAFAEHINPERFESLRKTLITTLEMPPENMSAMAERLFLLAFQYEGDFNWFDKRIASVKALTYEQLHTIALEFLSRSNSKRLAILVQGVLEPEHNFYYQPITKESISDLCHYTEKNKYQ